MTKRGKIISNIGFILIFLSGLGLLYMFRTLFLLIRYSYGSSAVTIFYPLLICGVIVFFTQKFGESQSSREERKRRKAATGSEASRTESWLIWLAVLSSIIVFLYWIIKIWQKGFSQPVLVTVALIAVLGLGFFMTLYPGRAKHKQ